MLISLIPLGWISFINYELSKSTLLDQTKKHLNALGFRQLALMTNFLKEKERSAAALAQESVPYKATETLDFMIRHFGPESPEYQQEAEKFGPTLVGRANTLNYLNLILVANDGMVVYSLHPPLIHPGTNLFTSSKESSIFSTIFQQTRDTLKPVVSPLTYFSQNSQPAIFLSTPIFNEEKSFVGVLIFQIDNNTLSQLVQNYRGLGNTGETLVAAEIDKQLVIFSSFLDKGHFPKVYRIDPTSPFGQFILKVLHDEPVSSTVVDYRGEEVLVIGKHLTSTSNWAIITKVDIEELLATIAEFKYLSWAVLLLTAILVTWIASYVAKKITTPIQSLTDKTKLMTAGDLSQKIETPYQDEIGKLGASFNEMASQLDHIVKHLDSLVEKRTAEVNQKNEQLVETIEELRQTQSRMITQEKLASLGALTAGIAHEIKNPLNFVNNFSELSIDIQKDLAAHIEKVVSHLNASEAEELHELWQTLELNLKKIHEHGKRADSIVYNMLQHSRGVPGEKVPTDVNTLLDEYVTLAFHGMRAKDGSFNVKIEKNYDPSLEKISLSPQEVCRVFLNLLNNAFYAVHQRKKKENGAYAPLVKVSTENHPDFVLIKIRDNGPGISNEVKEKLFTPFFTTKPTGEGTGLGLSLSYNIIVQGHGGAITVDSEEGQFAEFIIKLPK